MFDAVDTLTEASLAFKTKPNKQKTIESNFEISMEIRGSTSRRVEENEKRVGERETAMVIAKVTVEATEVTTKIATELATELATKITPNRAVGQCP